MVYGSMCTALFHHYYCYYIFDRTAYKSRRCGGSRNALERNFRFFGMRSPLVNGQ